MVDWIQGRVERVIYCREDYHILSFLVSESSDPSKRVSKPVGVRGNLCGLIQVAVGNTLHLVGKWARHAQYGLQFVFQSWEPWFPTPRDAEEFLHICIDGFASRALAKAVVAKYGLPALSKRPENPDAMLGDPPAGVPLESFQRAILGWEQAFKVRDLSTLLQLGGLSAFEIQAARTRFGTELAKIVKENPYCLMTILGFEFPKVDRLANRLGVHSDDPRRLEGAILWALQDAARQGGHLCLSTEELIKVVLTLSQNERLVPLPVGDDPFKAYASAVEGLLQKAMVVKGSDSSIYLPDYHMYEKESANLLAALLKPGSITLDPVHFLQEYEQANQICFSEAQRQVVEELGKHKVVVLTGLPGTGKTTSVRALVRFLEGAGISFDLLAPTGIAAKRLASVTGHRARTVHRALNYDGISWGRHASNRLPTGAVVVDEASMLDQELLYRLLVALRPDTILVLVGDDAQLPSVGPGNVLRELVGCSDVPNVRLTQVFRQVERSSIVRYSHDINRGAELVLDDTKDDPEFKFVRMGDEGTIVKLIVEMAAKLKSRDANFQVLSAKYDGVVGVTNLNERLRERLNPEGPPEWHRGDLRFREGDRLMVVKNDYRLGVYNGDVGKLLYSGKEGLVVRIHGIGKQIPDMEVTFTPEVAEEKLRLAYAVTVHKCVAPETLVETPEGLVSAGSLDPSGLIATPEGRAGYTGFTQNPASPMLEVETVDGYRLRVTPNHGVDAWSPEEGYHRVEAQNLVKGDFLCLRLFPEFDPQILQPLPPSPNVDSRALLHRIPRVVDYSAAEFLGLMVADGTVFSKGFRLAKRHLDVADRFEALCRELFGVVPHRFVANHAYHVEVDSSQIAAWLASLGGVSPNSKFVPEVILRSPISVQSAFLKGFFEDGTVNVKSDGTLDHIEVFSCFDSIPRVVKLLLLRLGIISGGSHRRNGSYTYIYGSNAIRFLEKVGFISEFKESRLRRPVGKETRYLVPVTRAELEEIISMNGGRKALTFTDKNAFARGTMSRHHLRDFLCRMHEHSPAWKTLDNRLLYHHSRVRSITPYEGPSVCIEVPEGHRFVQDGFCAWNSQGSEFDNIILPIVRSQGRMLQRNLLYTAVTRARCRVWLLGEESAIQQAIRNNKVVHRGTFFARAISESLRAGVGEEV